MVSAVSSFAFEVGDYAYTTTQRLKITNANLVKNGTFAAGLTEGGWCGLTLTEPVSATTWTVADGEGPNGETVVRSEGATADEPLCNVWGGLYGGQTYIVSFMAKAEGSVATTVGTTVGNNYVDFFLNNDGSLAHAASTDEAPVTNVATAVNLTNEWQTYTFAFTPDEGQQLVMHIEKLATGTMITNISVHQVTVVYDDRIALRKVAFANKILADENFTATDDALAAKAEFEETVYGYINELLNTPGGLDDIGEAEYYMEQFDNGLVDFMNVSTDDMATENFFKNVTNLTAMGKYNRGQIANGQVIDGFIFRGENWQHAASGDVLVKQIQDKYDVGKGSVALYNTNFPAGKYYLAAEVRNGYCDKNYYITYNLEAGVKAFIGTDTVDCGVIHGEDYDKFYMVGELKEGETFEAGFWWDGPATGARFEIKNFECRAFGDIKAEVERAAVWTTFIAQYNAVVSARKTLVDMQADATYPWAKDSLARALEAWDPYYNTLMSNGWVAEDGSDTREATTEELADWALYQGVKLYDEDGNLLTYQLVRGYQNAINYVKEENKVFATLANEIAAAEILRDDDMNQLGDKATFQAAIDAAQNTLTTTLAATTDETREADEATVNQAIEDLKAAEEAFKASVPEQAPLVDIDFTDAQFEPIITVTPGEEGEEDIETTTGYTIQGAVGQMDFTTSSVTVDDDGTFANDQATFALGCGGADVTNADVLRIGKGTATVNLAEADIPTDDEVLRTTFDVWFGGLINRNVDIELQNAAGERVAGFSYSLYGGSTAYNDFLNEAGEGLNIAACGKSTNKDGNANLLVDKYKWQFDLIVDYKANTVQANLPTSPTGAKNGGLVALKQLEDNKIAKFVINSNYDNADRRSWFDNLKIVKYNSSASGINETVGIATVNTDNVKATGAVYTLSGVQVKGAPAKGLYIKDGKKFVVK